MNPITLSIAAIVFIYCLKELAQKANDLMK